MKKPTLVVLVAVLALAAGLGGGYLLFGRVRDPQLPAESGSGATPSTPTVTEVSEPGPGPVISPEKGADPSPTGRDAAATMVLILEAHRRGDGSTVAMWSTQEGAAQLSSYPPGAFDPALLSCAPDPDRPDSDVLCNLRPARVQVGQATALLRQTGEGYRLMLVVPVVD